MATILCIDDDPRILQLQNAVLSSSGYTVLTALDGFTGIALTRHQEWLKFLRLLDHAMPAHLDLHLIGDNYATHKHPKVQRWLERHPRFHMHFTPTSASWLNMVERFFRDLTQNRLRRGVFRDLEELFMAIGSYLDRHNENPKPFIWTARASDILEKVKRARRALDKRQSA
jgi:transposase